MFRCFTRDELRINRCILTISNLTNELSLNYTINNRFVVLLGMNHTYFINIKRVKKCSLTHPTTYQFYTHTIYTRA